MGRTWDYFHEVLLHWGGAIVIVGTIVLLALAYLIIGQIRIAAGRSGQKILRFKAFERFSHWLTGDWPLKIGRKHGSRTCLGRR
jgi:formate dehydrogenase subunit gamma